MFITKRCVIVTLFLIIAMGIIVLIFTSAVAVSKTMSAQGLSPGDPSSYSLPEIVRVTSIHINLTVSFETKTFAGNVDLNVTKIDPSATQLVLDSKKLNISKIVDKTTQQQLKFDVGKEHDEFGAKLTVELPKEREITLSIFYETDPKASGLQWLTPQQTAGKVHPYVFSQFQAIHARSFMPCQDTPSVKSVYSATITAPKHLTVLMSALNQGSSEENTTKTYKFNQPIPIPSYLTAIAVGNLQSREIGPRSHVWAEPEIVDECANEFADTEKQLKTAEDICGPYVWTTYDLLVLPPSFAYGGMENPCLTFVTPTLLAGDKSLANVVAHEIAHSWTGNLITNRNFEHFWLNEGFTVLIERKIKGRLFSKQEEDFCALQAVGELKECIKQLGETSAVTDLVVNLKGLHPDDAFSMVPYEKGYNFLRYLQGLVGGAQVFEEFLKKYFDNFKYKSIDTSDFKKFFETYFADNKAIKTVDWNAWLNKPGMPPIIPEYDKTIADECDKVVKDLLDWDVAKPAPKSLDKLKSNSTSCKIYILQKLVENDAPLNVEQLNLLDTYLSLSSIKNSEIKYRWFRIALKAKFQPIVEPTLNWLNEVGRMKFVRPLYRDLYAWTDVRQKAIDNFLAHKDSMMHVVSYVLMQDLHLKQ